MMHSGYQKDIKNKTKLQERKTGVKEGEDTEGKHKEGEWERKGPENEQQKREALCLWKEWSEKKKKKLQDNLLLFLIRKSETVDGSSIGVK